MTGETFFLPRGGITKDSEEYVAEWKKIGNAVAQSLNCRVLGFDPGFLCQPNDGGRSFELPVSCAIAAYDNYEEMRELKFRMEGLEK